ncbi:MAG TPA: hypothetical protein VLB27_08660 [candidate division Zixibacteria bacterium]|nr:hypothetical protein [candidate division Zixibacteria bacterium]
MTLLLGRRVRVQIGLPGEVGIELNATPENGGEGPEIGFQVDHKLDGKPNKATVEIWNPPRGAFQLAQRSDCLVRLFAGYDVPKLAFQGNPLPRYGAAVELVGGDRVLRILAQDGRRAYQQADISRSWGTDVLLSEVVARIGVDMGTPVAPLPEAMGSQTLPQGITLSGSPRNALKALSAAIGAVAMVRDGVLYVVPEGEATGEAVIVFSPVQGNCLKVTPQKDGIISMMGNLDASLRPGRRFVIKDHADFSGTYKARDVSFKGSRGYDTDFNVTVTGRAI